MVGHLPPLRIGKHTQRFLTYTYMIPPPKSYITTQKFLFFQYLSYKTRAVTLSFLSIRHIRGLNDLRVVPCLYTHDHIITIPKSLKNIA